MDSSSISDGEIRIKALELSPAELIQWIFEQTDDLYRQLGDLEAASVFRADLLGRLEDELGPEKSPQLTQEFFIYQCTTALDGDDVRGELPQQMKRQKIGEALEKLSTHTGESPNKVAERMGLMSFIEEEIQKPDEYSCTSDGIISEATIQEQLRENSPTDLVAWAYDQRDKRFLEIGNSWGADEFLVHLSERIERALDEELRPEFAAAFIDRNLTTKVNEAGERVALPRAEQRRNRKQFDKNNKADEGMCLDANGQALMSMDKLAEIMEVSPEELEANAMQMLQDGKLNAGFAPFEDETGHIHPMKFLDADS